MVAESQRSDITPNRFSMSTFVPAFVSERHQCHRTVGLSSVDMPLDLFFRL